MNAEFDAPKEVAQNQTAGDTSALSNVQADSFKSFDSFSSIKDSMSSNDSSAKSSLPDLQLVDSQPSDTNQNRPGENQNPGDDAPRNPNPNESQNPGDGNDGKRNDDPRSKNQPGSDPSGKQLDGTNAQEGDPPKSPGQENVDGPLQPPADGDDGRSKDHTDNRSKPNPDDGRQKELQEGQSSGDQAQAGDQGKPGQDGTPPSSDDTAPGQHPVGRDGSSKPTPEDPGQAKQRTDAQSAGDEAYAQQARAPFSEGRSGSAQTDNQLENPAGREKPGYAPGENF